jgi:hypothetical protein
MGLRILEIIGQLLFGDGVTCMIVPRRHMLLWRDAFNWQPWRNLIEWLADRPNTTILIGLVESLAGLWCIVRSSRDQ